MDKKIITTFIKCLVFLCLVLTLMIRYTQIFMNKQELFCSATLNQYPKDSIEVLFLGSSQMIYAAQPMILWEEYGITSYNMATSATTIPGNYWEAEIAFEMQKPKVVILDCTFAYVETKTFDELPRIHAAIDGFWPSKSAYQAITDLVEISDERFEFFWTPYIYHTRWKELSQLDFEDVSDHGAGGAYLACHTENFEGMITQYSKDQKQAVPVINLEYIKKLLLLCNKNGAELVLTVLPIPLCVGYQPIYNTLQEWAEENGIPFINGYDDPTFWQLDYGTDFTDIAHMNIHGVKKSSSYFGDYLVTHYTLGLHDDEQTYTFWNDRLEEYTFFRDSIWTCSPLAYNTAITFSDEGNQNSFYGDSIGPDRCLDISGTFTWTTGPRTDFYFTIEEPADALLQVNLQAVQPIIGKDTRTVDIYVNEQYTSSVEVEATMDPTSFTVDIDKSQWSTSEEQKLTFKYPDRDQAEFGGILLNYTLGLKEIYLERR